MMAMTILNSRNKTKGNYITKVVRNKASSVYFKEPITWIEGSVHITVSSTFD